MSHSFAPLRLALLATLGLTLTGCLSHHVGALPGEPKGNYLQLDDARVRYADSGGDGPVVLMLHGFAASLNTWDPVVPAVTPTHRVIRLDLKGFGWTDRPEGDYSPAAQARLAFALLDKLGIEDVSVVAHSWGSSVALAMAMAKPERVRRIALYDAWVFHEQLPTFFVWARANGLGEALFWMFYKERAEDRMAMAFHRPERVTQALIDNIEATLDRPGAVYGALHAARAQRFDDVQGNYGTIEQPVLLLWGENDEVSPMWVAHRLARELPNATLQSYGECGHFPMIEARHASTRRLVRFLAGDLL